MSADNQSEAPPDSAPAQNNQAGAAPDREGGGKGNAKQDSDKDRPPEKKPLTPEQRRKRKRLIVFGAIGVAVLVVLVLLYWFIFLRGRIDTDDAYIDGRAVIVAAKVGGYVQRLAVTDNQFVKAGDLILQIDPRDYDVAVQNAEASLDAVQAQLQSAQIDREIRLTSTRSDLVAARAARAQAQSNLTKALADLRRQRAVDPQATTQQITDAATAGAQVQQAQLRQAQAQVDTAALVPQNIALADAKVEQLQAQVKAAEAQLAQARLNLGYTQLRAAQDGRVTRRNVEVGTYLQPGQSLLVLVSPEVWVTANYKENQLVDMRPGQPVTVSVDAFPGLDLHGHVDSIQMGSGSRFSAFPAENATGNFVKIVQRIPVKIVIDRGLDPNRPLPLGASVVPTVDVR